MSPHEFSAAQAASHIRKGKLSCADLAKDLIKRSEQLNPELNLWAELDPERVIEDAIKRIDNGTYGKCPYGNEVIDEERLRAMPFTRYCVSCIEEDEEFINSDF